MVWLATPAGPLILTGRISTHAHGPTESVCPCHVVSVRSGSKKEEGSPPSQEPLFSFLKYTVVSGLRARNKWDCSTNGSRLGSRLGSASEDDDDDDDGDDDDEMVRNTNNSRLTRQQPPTSLNTENRGGRRSAGSNSEEDDMSPGVVEQYRSAGYASSPTKKPSSWQRRLEREGSEDMESI